MRVRVLCALAVVLCLAVNPAEADQIELKNGDRVTGNPVLPAVHGGVIGAFLETTAIFQVMLETDGDLLPKPITLTVAYLRSAGPRETFARATITKQGRRVVSVRVEAWQDDPGKTVATAQGQFLLAADDRVLAGADG